MAAAVSGVFGFPQQANPFEGMVGVEIFEPENHQALKLDGDKLRSIVIHEETGAIGFSFNDSLQLKRGIATVFVLRRFEEEIMHGGRRTWFGINKSGTNVELEQSIITKVGQFLHSNILGDAFAGLGWYKPSAIQMFSYSNQETKTDNEAVDCGRVSVRNTFGSSELMPAIRVQDGVRILCDGLWVKAALDDVTAAAIKDKPFIGRFTGAPEESISKYSGTTMLSDEGNWATIVRFRTTSTGLRVELVEPEVSVTHLGICLGKTPGDSMNTFTFIRVRGEGDRREAAAVFHEDERALHLLELAAKAAEKRRTGSVGVRGTHWSHIGS